MDKKHSLTSRRTSSQSNRVTGEKVAATASSKPSAKPQVSNSTQYPQAPSEGQARSLRDRYAIVLASLKLTDTALRELSDQGSFAEIEFMELQVRFRDEKSLKTRQELVLDYAAKAGPQQQAAVESISGALAQAHLDSAIDVARGATGQVDVQAFTTALKDSGEELIAAAQKQFASAQVKSQPYQWLMTGIARTMTNPSVTGVKSDEAARTMTALEINSQSGARAFVGLLGLTAQARPDLLPMGLKALAAAIPALPSTNAGTKAARDASALRNQIRAEVRTRLEVWAGMKTSASQNAPSPAVAAALREAMALFDPPKTTGSGEAPISMSHRAPVETNSSLNMHNADKPPVGEIETKASAPSHRQRSHSLPGDDYPRPLFSSVLRRGSGSAGGMSVPPAPSLFSSPSSRGDTSVHFESSVSSFSDGKNWYGTDAAQSTYGFGSTSPLRE
ncbi:MAG TPA: hypothetical protein VLJ86_11580, partial [Ramlibacter sp.]|nr:hypothetical protein [Ramlibacter sp.]